MAGCDVCFHHCQIPEGRRGFCGARACRDGEVVPENYSSIPERELNPV